MPWVGPPRATPCLRCTKMVTHGARDSADEDNPAKGSPLRTSSTPQVLYPRISHPRSRPTAFPSQAIRAGSLLHRLTDQSWGSKWHTTVKVARKCWWGTFYYGGGPRHAFLLTNKGPVWANSRKFRDLAVWSSWVATANWRVRLKVAPAPFHNPLSSPQGSFRSFQTAGFPMHLGRVRSVHPRSRPLAPEPRRQLANAVKNRPPGLPRPATKILTPDSYVLDKELSNG
jgi:hypothetical protein